MVKSQSTNSQWPLVTAAGHVVSVVRQKITSSFNCGVQFGDVVLDEPYPSILALHRESLKIGQVLRGSAISYLLSFATSRLLSFSALSLLLLPRNMNTLLVTLMLKANGSKIPLRSTRGTSRAFSKLITPEAVVSL